MIPYAWTIEANGRQPLQRVTTIEEMHDVLRVLDLPGVVPPDCVTWDAWNGARGRYTHDCGGDDEWSVSWTRVGGPGT
ncbi:hypothetical protein QO002_005743 [Pararhizobium capsulatum DSM 1112]|uniref:Uncharacterized protein n=1 Tax=Pararhizobium capsulatum DSM 1112 TaxID=1121113 RepID=A0ABU0C007_9HYPH|nr:hypothetical protein [Pararhizobium capsulatum DSM 1112]